MMKFNDNQIKAINKYTGNTSVIATAGSGKTAVITERIKNLITKHKVRPENILAVTFSKKAKENIENRLDALCLGVNIETFHSVALKIIQSYYKGKYKLWTKTWEKENCLFDICKKHNLCKIKEDLPLNELLCFISMQKTNMTNIDNLLYDDNVKHSYSKEELQLIYREYEEYKNKNKYIEFDDLLNYVCDIFNKSENTLNTYQEKYQYILVDEFQDVSLNQALFLKYLSKKYNNLFVVGDGCQAIYHFRGGISKYLLDFDTEWDNTEVINLNLNYRCSQDIVTTANELAKYLPESKNKNYIEAQANRGISYKPVFIECDSTNSEVDVVITTIKELIQKAGYSYNDIAILARTNAQFQHFENGAVKHNVPYLTFDNTKFIDRPEIKLIISYLQIAFDEKSDSAFAYVYNKPSRWLGKSFIDEIARLAKIRKISFYNAMFEIDVRDWKYKNGIEAIHNIINQLRNRRFSNIGEMIDFIRKELDIDNYISRGKLSEDGSYSEQVETLNSFVDICKDFETYTEFKRYLKRISQYEALDQNDRISLMTIHKSKGLEFPVVFVVGCSDGLFPHSKCDNINDEKRLMYVAITRAMDRLYLTSNQFYNGRELDNSPFIDLIASTVEQYKINDYSNQKRM